MIDKNKKRHIIISVVEGTHDDWQEPDGTDRAPTDIDDTLASFLDKNRFAQSAAGTAYLMTLLAFSPETNREEPLTAEALKQLRDVLTVNRADLIGEMTEATVQRLEFLLRLNPADVAAWIEDPAAPYPFGVWDEEGAMDANMHVWLAMQDEDADNLGDDCGEPDQDTFRRSEEFGDLGEPM